MLAIRFGWQDNLFRQPEASEFRTVKIRGSTSCHRPTFQVRQLNGENCRLDFVQAEIAADYAVIIPRIHSLIAENAHLSCELVVPAQDHSGITSGPEVF